MVHGAYTPGIDEDLAGRTDTSLKPAKHALTVDIGRRCSSTLLATPASDEETEQGALIPTPSLWLESEMADGSDT